jgi:hypothetical protein
MSVLGSVFRIIGRVVTAPLRLFGAGGGLAVPPAVPMPQSFEAATAPDHSQIYDDIARVVMSWCADSIAADRPVVLPPGLPISVREWAPGLNREECWEIMEADRMAVSSHLRGLFVIPGVRKVQSLARINAWPAEPVNRESAGYAAVSALEPAGPGRA